MEIWQWQWQMAQVVIDGNLEKRQAESAEQYRKQYSESSKPSTSFRQQVSQLRDFGARR